MAKETYWTQQQTQSQKLLFCWDFDKTLLKIHTGGDSKFRVNKEHLRDYNSTKVVLDKLRNHSHNMAILTFGISEKPSHTLLELYGIPSEEVYVFASGPLDNKNISINYAVSDLKPAKDYEQSSRDSVILIDDDLNNCQAAIKEGFMAFYLHITPTSNNFLHILEALNKIIDAPQQRHLVYKDFLKKHNSFNNDIFALDEFTKRAQEPLKEILHKEHFVPLDNFLMKASCYIQEQEQEREEATLCLTNIKALTLKRKAETDPSEALESETPAKNYTDKVQNNEKNANMRRF